MPLFPDEIAAWNMLFWGMMVAALVAFVTLFFISAPHGRTLRKGWGPTLPATLGWILMEAPSPLLFALFWAVGDPERRFSAPGLIFLGMWELHYLHRAFIFPFRRRGGQPDMPVLVLALAVLFNVCNATLNARWLYTLGPVRDASWLHEPRFWVGVALFAVGFAVNQHADHVLFNLRKPGETGYKIPYGGLYRFVSCPNYLGELVAWTGFAVATGSPGAWAFVVWSAANLVPRARTHHRWYRERFPDYPPERRALLPLIF